VAGLIEKSTHLEEALAQLAEQFKRKPNVEALLAAFVAQVQELEGVLFDLMEDRAIDTAAGIQLDGLGIIINEERQGRDDSAYRQAIRARVMLNTSSGTPEDIIEIARAVLGNVEIEIIEAYPAHFDAIVNDPVTPDPPAWQPSTSYALSDKRSSFGNVYVVVVAGTSAASGGPSGTGAGIVDGTVTWNYSGLGVGARAATLVLSGKPAGVKGIIQWHEDATPFAFDTDPEGAGFDAGAFAQAHDF